MLTGLLQRASYQVQVAGSTAVGMGPYSEEVAVFTEKEGMFLVGLSVCTSVSPFDNPSIHKVVNKVWGNQTQPSLVSV